MIIFTKQDLGKAFKAERKALGKTQQWVADQVGCRRATIVALEGGQNVSLDILLAALTSLGKRIDIRDARPTESEMQALLGTGDDEN